MEPLKDPITVPELKALLPNILEIETIAGNVSINERVNTQLLNYVMKLKRKSELDKERQRRYNKTYYNTKRGRESHRLRDSRTYYKRQLKKTLALDFDKLTKDKVVTKTEYITKCKKGILRATAKLKEMGLK